MSRGDFMALSESQKRAVAKYNLDIPVYGMVKNSKHQTRGLMSPERKELDISEQLMKAITNLQDTVHDTAISYHRKLRDKGMIESELDNIEGIGKIKKQLLLKEFGSVENIRKASIAELLKVKGITKKLANEIKSKLDN